MLKFNQHILEFHEWCPRFLLSECDNWIGLHRVFWIKILASDRKEPTDCHHYRFWDRWGTPMHRYPNRQVPECRACILCLRSSIRLHPYWLAYKTARSFSGPSIRRLLDHSIHGRRPLRSQSMNLGSWLLSDFWVHNLVRRIRGCSTMHGSKRYVICLRIKYGLVELNKFNADQIRTHQLLDGPMPCQIRRRSIGN